MAEGQRRLLKGRTSWPTFLRKRVKRSLTGDTDYDTDMSAPILPPRPVSHDETNSSAVGLTEVKSAKQSLYELADIYSGKFPVTARVFTGLRRKTPVTELLTVEQASCPDVVTCSYNGQRFSIPLSVDMKFSVLWDESGKDDVEILAGKEFTTDSLLRCHGNGPKVISAKQHWEKDGGSVEVGEVLVVKKFVSKADTPSELKVFSLTTRAEKTLPLTCPVLFTNRAQCISLHLPDIVAYVPDLFPCRACILRHDFGPKCYPTYIVTLEGLGKTRVLKFTSTLQAMSPSEAQPTTFVVPVDLPGVEVAVVTDGAIFSDNVDFPADDGDDVARGDSPHHSESRGSEPSTTPPTTPLRCEMPVYEELLLRSEATLISTDVVITVSDNECNAAMAGADATHEGGTVPIDSPTETARSRPTSPVYERPSFRVSPSPSHKTPCDEGYVVMTSDLTISGSGHVIPPGAISSSEYEEMKMFTPKSCEAKSKAKKLSVIYVNKL